MNKRRRFRTKRRHVERKWLEREAASLIRRWIDAGRPRC
jgi:hypothetical protein